MQIYGIGTDIIEISRIEKAINQTSLFRRKVYTEKEIEHIEKKRHPYASYAGRFAAKEAVSKALGTGIRGFSLLDIEVLRDELGKPYVKLYGNAREIFLKLGGTRLEVSISNTATLVIATAVLFGNSLSFAEFK